MSPTPVYVDLSDLLRHNGRTGIQRVVRQVIPRLTSDGGPALDIRMLRFDPVAHHYEELDTQSMLDVLAGTSGAPTVIGHRGVGDFAPRDIFLDLDSAWNSPLKRSALYPRLKDAGVTIVSYVYDLVPLKVPKVVHETTTANWVLYLTSVLTWSDLVMTDSRCSERDFLELKRDLDVRRHIPTLVTRLGADLPEVGEPNAEELVLLEPFSGGRFVLFVGTIEPRKEHLVALGAFDELAARFPDLHLVIAGRKGWIEDVTLPTILGHPAYGERVHWVEAPSDALLAELYARATACLYLSRYEGFGLPIAEALSHGRVTVASHQSAMHEVGDDACDYVWHNVVPEVVETLGHYLGDRRLLAERERYIRDSFRPIGWDTVARTIRTALGGLSHADDVRRRPRPSKLQVVVVSADLERLERAIAAWEAHSHLASRYLAVVPAALAEGVGAIRARVPVVALDDSRLEAGLSSCAEIDDVFILAGDEHLPLAEVVVEDFIDCHGRMRAYWFQELKQWTRRDGAFDDAQRAAAAALGSEGYELLGYASHQPQVVDKALWGAAMEWAAETGARSSLCEWATYFNHAVTRYPTLFAKQVFRTLNWPPQALDWACVEPPEQIVFEYADAASYTTGVFKGLALSGDAAAKTKRKEQQLEPYVRSRRMFARSRHVLRRNGLMHGPLRFAGDDFELLVAGLPQLLTVAADSHLRLDLAFQLIGQPRAHARIGVAYRIGRGPAHTTVLTGVGTPTGGYASGTISVPMGGAQPGIHEVEFFLDVDGTLMQARGLRYLTAMVVVAANQRPARLYAELAAQYGPAEEPVAPEGDGGRGTQGPAVSISRAITRSGRSAPVYGVEGVGGQAEDRAQQRARAIEEHVGRLVGKRVLVIGSAFGYLPMYFADRGAKVHGWEADVASVHVARQIARLTGSSAALGAVSDLTTRISSLEAAVYDLAIIDPAVPPASPRTREWIKLLTERVPVVIHEGAPGEEPVGDERCRVLGHFAWEDEVEERPLVVREAEKTVTVNGHTFPYERVTAEAYEGVPLARQDRFRRFYLHPEFVVKEYHFTSTSEEEFRQPLREIDIYVNVLNGVDVWHLASLVDFELSSAWVRTVYRTVPGDLLRDLAPLGHESATSVAHDLLRTLGDLAAVGLHHNDIRSWNVILGHEGAWLIDYGLCWYEPSESNPIALLWTLNAAVTGEAEGFATGKTALPPRDSFEGTPLDVVYEAIAAGEQDWSVLLSSLERETRRLGTPQTG